MGGGSLAVPTHPRRPEPEYAEILEPAPLPDPGLVVALEGLGLEEEEVREEREEGMEGGEREEEKEEVEAEECLVCSERLPLVTYLPCSHRILCTECRWQQKLASQQCEVVLSDITALKQCSQAGRI